VRGRIGPKGTEKKGEKGGVGKGLGEGGGGGQHSPARRHYSSIVSNLVLIRRFMDVSPTCRRDKEKGKGGKEGRSPQCSFFPRVSAHMCDTRP